MAPPDGRTRFKSRFSLVSLLPARHPPLIISHPVPVPQHSLREISLHPTIVSELSISPVHSQYAVPCTPRSNSPPILPPWDESTQRPQPKIPKTPPKALQKTEAESSMTPTRTPKRPPPIDIDRIKRAYPSPPAVNLVIPSMPLQPVANELPLVRPTPITKSDKKAPKPPKVIDDPFDFAEVEPGHRYPSWRGGKVDIKPGQVLPKGVLDTWTRKEENTWLNPQTPVDMCDSVLHNVLLTPTYLRTSPDVSGFESPSPLSRTGSKREKRKTLIDRAAETFQSVRQSNWLSVPKVTRFYTDDKDRVVQEMREREQKQMDRFRQGSYGYTSGVPPGSAYVRKSPGWVGRHELGLGYEEKKWWKRSKGLDSTKKQKLWRYSIILVILCLAGLVIGLCVSLINKPTTTTYTTSVSNATSASPTSTVSATTPSRTSQSLSTCLQSFQTAASTSPLTYPCSDCVPLLTSTTNDYTTPLVNGNSTGVGAALQFCSLMDIYRASGNGSILGNGWARDTSPCVWNGISCDSRGRVTIITLKYPAVPNQLPATLENIAALQAIHVMGNSSIPTGTFPSEVLSLPNFDTLDLEYTALTGMSSSTNFSKAPGLVTLVLANNKYLGTALPNLSNNQKLLTLAVTGQGLTNVAPDTLPNTLTYLDLSFNSLTGTVPSFNELSNLKTLYLQSNLFTTSPLSLPSSLTTLSLTSNPNLAGNTSSICTLSQLTNCDLRSTKLSPNTTVPIISQNSNATTTIGSAVVTRSCGVCLF